jgi:hypothetical protein
LILVLGVRDTFMQPTKSAPILAVIDSFTERLGAGAFLVVDHWPADLDAIGIASPRDTSRLMYVSSYGCAVDEYFVSFEGAPVGDAEGMPYTPLGERSVHGLDALIEAFQQHIGAIAA